MVGGDNIEQRLARATRSPQRKRDNAGTANDHGIQGEANKSFDHQLTA